ncbi:MULTISPECIES: DUF6124 family protein [Pseudomonas]|jgi:1,2-phenylacetyl-CoA epoxidase catalytic subunit|uniref:DUF6124 family protein n=1 Tax=Pseudomonas TaxID=286 RepID=UPI0008769D76|nr:MULTISPECIES: DUF6124 family protein [Pseudomonas]MDB6444891.1 DUF6124 family protein [Pseudomonas sp. 21TX0197]MDT8908043.1 DUF6124 family protein [Pseudomonas prosekii]NHN70715.1 hypothetical protein [Pseudomonas fluorescens]ROO32220.1 hypothetical protein BIV09_26100 [Pseudomonas sp. 7SR1]ROO34484.1 hypothetical protein BIV08_06220 [Pseudomonas sp. AF76]
MFKVTPNPPEDPGFLSDNAAKTKKLDEAAERALDYYLNPKTAEEAAGKTQAAHLFMVAPHIDTETLLANASEDLLSISAIAANLADDVEGSRRSVVLAISRMAEGVHLLVERAMDRLEAQPS